MFLAEVGCASPLALPIHGTKTRKIQLPAFFFLPLPFVASSDECVTPHQTVGEALLPQTLPRSTRRGMRETLAYVYWWHVDILSLLFHSVEDFFFFCCNSVLSQTKEAQAKSTMCSSWVSFLFLSQFSSAEAAQAQATSSSSVFCHGKKLETQEQENVILL